MQKKRCAVFSCLGLGDGLIALMLSHNLEQNGYDVTTYHPSLSSLQTWFPHLPIEPFSSLGKEREMLGSFDRLFIFFEKTPWMQEVVKHCETLYPGRTCILNPIATPNKDYLYWSHGKFNGNLCFVDNLYNFCKEILGLENVVKSNGMTRPSSQAPRDPKQVVLHPTSSRPGKNWPQEKFLKLAEELKKQGYKPAFALTSEERKQWPLEKIDAPLFSNFSQLASLVDQSSYMIGNDSGVGHLASSLGLPTVTICRNQLTANFWQPGFSKAVVVVPPKWLPNIKGLRLRDKQWKRWISVDKVIRHFQVLLKEAP